MESTIEKINKRIEEYFNDSVDTKTEHEPSPYQVKMGKARYKTLIKMGKTVPMWCANCFMFANGCKKTNYCQECIASKTKDGFIPSRYLGTGDGSKNNSPRRESINVNIDRIS